ncbi:MAG: hypothetical protein ABSD31_12090 [Candidatus Binataceae bacterium]|jgi:hypothetical protein
MTVWDIMRLRLANPATIVKFITYLPQFIRLFYRLMLDERVSLLTKAVPILGLLLLLSPPLLELDLIPFIGELDTIVVIGLSLKLFVWLCPPDVVREHVARIAHGA